MKNLTFWMRVNLYVSAFNAFNMLLALWREDYSSAVACAGCSLANAWIAQTLWRKREVIRRRLEAWK